MHLIKSEKSFEKHASDKILTPWTHEKRMKLVTTKKINGHRIGTFSEDETQMAGKCIKNVEHQYPSGRHKHNPQWDILALWLEWLPTQALNNKCR